MGKPRKFLKKAVKNFDEVNDHFAVIDTILEQHSLHLHDTIIGVMPPIPISVFVEVPPEDGVIFRYIFAGSGTIIKCALAIGTFRSRIAAKFHASFDGPGGGRYEVFETASPRLVKSLNISVKAGDRLTLTVDNPQIVAGVWAGFLFEFDLREMHQERFLLGEFEGLNSERV